MDSLALWGAMLVGLNIVVPITLHLLDIPITANTLALAHLSLALLVSVPYARGGAGSCSGRLVEPRRSMTTADLIPMAATAFAILVIPVTYIAGVDTYKWQDLAGNIAVEGRIRWLIHPISLFGFTPRSYSSAQPLVLATIEILGHTGVDWGFYLLSLCFGITGLAGARLLGRRILQTESHAEWFALLYLFSPVFMRYNYWATGRGLLLALLPLYLLTLFNLFRPASPIFNLTSTIYNLLSFLALSLLLALSHKAGVVGVIMIPTLFLLSPALVILRGRWGLLVVFLASLGAGLLLAGSPITLAYSLITRFGWLVPLMAMGLYSSSPRFTSPPVRAMLAGAFALLILSCTPDMYGALLALPFVAFVATIGLMPLIEGTSSRQRTATLALLLVPAIAIVVNQALHSPSESLYRAAQFLEQHDPKGPFRVDAPGQARAQIQAYVSGCPRFTATPGQTDEVELRPPPVWAGHPARDARHWIDYLREMFDLRGATTDWYGDGKKVYTVTIAGKGAVPPGAKLLFTHGNVKVFGPAELPGTAQ